MTFQEYLNQENPKKNPNVVLQMEDIYHFWTHNFKTGKVYIILLMIESEVYEYSLDEGDTILWTTDDQGNKHKISCFRIENFQEPTQKPKD